MPQQTAMHPNSIQHVGELVMVACASIPGVAVISVALAKLSEEPLVALGVGSALLGLVVLMVKWLMSRSDAQQAQQERLICALQESVREMSEWNHAEEREREIIRSALTRIEDRITNGKAQP